MRRFASSEIFADVGIVTSVGVGDALVRIAKQEGVSRLWAGASPTVVRAMALNFGQ